MTLPISGLTIDHPLPQLLELQQKTLLVEATSLKLVNADWSTTSLATLTEGSLAHVADFGKYVIFTNGTETYHCDVSTGVFSAASSVTFPNMKTLCRLQGRIFGGNIMNSFYDCDTHFACWSQPGENVFVPDEKNLAGFRDMEIGTIYKCLPLGTDSVIYYGSKGVARLFQTEAGIGYKLVAKTRICGREAVCGGDYHVFCDTEGRLWTIDQEGINLLDYSWVLGNMTLSDVVISRDAVLKDYYISDGTSCYLLSANGLSESNNLVTNVVRIEGLLYGIFTVGVNAFIEIHFNNFNYNLAALTSLEYIELGLMTDGSPYVTDLLQYRGRSDVSLSWRFVSKENFGVLQGTAQTHRPKLKVTTATEFKLEFITLNIKLDDNRINNQLQTISEGSWNVS